MITSVSQSVNQWMNNSVMKSVVDNTRFWDQHREHYQHFYRFTREVFTDTLPWEFPLSHLSHLCCLWSRGKCCPHTLTNSAQKDSTIHEHVKQPSLRIQHVCGFSLCVCVLGNSPKNTKISTLCLSWTGLTFCLGPYVSAYHTIPYRHRNVMKAYTHGRGSESVCTV